MSGATQTCGHSHVQVPAARIVWLIIGLPAAIVVMWTVTTAWQGARAGAGPTPAQIHLTPSPAPGPMVGQPYPNHVRSTLVSRER